MEDDPTLGPLVPFDFKDVKATYNTSTKTLSVVANGLFPSKASAPEFERDPEFVGGRRLRLVCKPANPGGPEVPRTARYAEPDVFGPLRFSAVVVVALSDWRSKKEVTQLIPIATVSDPAPPPIVPFIAQPLPPVKQNDPNALLMPAKAVQLPARNFVRVTAPIPNPAVFRYTIEARSDTPTLYVWRAGETQATMYWDLVWADNTVASQKGTFVVVTTQGAAAQPSGALQITAQPYSMSMEVASKL